MHILEFNSHDLNGKTNKRLKTLATSMLVMDVGDEMYC